MANAFLPSQEFYDPKTELLMVSVPHGQSHFNSEFFFFLLLDFHVNSYGLLDSAKLAVFARSSSPSLFSNLIRSAKRRLRKFPGLRLLAQLRRNGVLAGPAGLCR